MHLNNRNKTIWLITLSVFALALMVVLPSCKSCKKPKEETTVVTDTTSNIPLTNSGTLTTPHGDSALIPVFAGILEQAFEASRKKDYETLSSLVLYRGPDMQRHGTDVFRIKNSYDKTIVRMTGEVFSKWTTGTESIDYTRVFELPQPDGRTLEVLEVIIVYPKKIDRKFFGFLQVDGTYKIADVTSYL